VYVFCLSAPTMQLRAGCLLSPLCLCVCACVCVCVCVHEGMYIILCFYTRRLHTKVCTHTYTRTYIHTPHGKRKSKFDHELIRKRVIPWLSCVYAPLLFSLLHHPPPPQAHHHHHHHHHRHRPPLHRNSGPRHPMFVRIYMQSFSTSGVCMLCLCVT
jgi:hypothetical protein